MIILLARSTVDVSNDARYIWVTVSDAWPMPWLIMLTGMPLEWAIDAHEWRAQYKVSGMWMLSIAAIFLRFRLIL